MKGEDFANAHCPTVFQRCWTVIQAADVRKILDLYPRFHMIPEQCSSFPAFSDELEKPSYQFWFLIKGIWQHGNLRLQRFAVFFYFICVFRMFSLCCFPWNFKLQFCMFKLLIKQDGLAFVSSLTYFFFSICVNVPHVLNNTS